MAGGLVRLSRIMLRIAGDVRCGGGPAALFPSFGLVEAAGLDKGEGDHRHQAMALQTGP